MASDPKKRFSGRAGYYSKYRPSYPASILQYLERELGFSRNVVVADIGSGIGIFAELLLRNGNRVLGYSQTTRCERMRKLHEHQRFSGTYDHASS